MKVISRLKCIKPFIDQVFHTHEQTKTYRKNLHFIVWTEMHYFLLLALIDR